MIPSVSQNISIMCIGVVFDTFYIYLYKRMQLPKNSGNIATNSLKESPITHRIENQTKLILRAAIIMEKDLL